MEWVAEPALAHCRREHFLILWVFAFGPWPALPGKSSEILPFAPAVNSRGTRIEGSLTENRRRE
jgi:hypothetical protein